MKKGLLLSVVLLACKQRDAALEADAAVVVAVADASAPKTSSSAAVPDAAVPACIHVDADEAKAGMTTLEGTVRKSRHSHPNGSSFEFYFLELAKPVCVVGSEELKETKEVQLLSTTDLRTYEKLDGKKVSVTGTAFPEETAYHVRPVLLDVRSLTKR